MNDLIVEKKPGGKTIGKGKGIGKIDEDQINVVAYCVAGVVIGIYASVKTVAKVTRNIAAQKLEKLDKKLRNSAGY